MWPRVSENPWSTPFRTSSTDPPPAAAPRTGPAQRRQVHVQPQPRHGHADSAAPSDRPRPPRPASACPMRGRSRARHAPRAPAPSPCAARSGNARFQPVAEQRRHLPRQAQHDPACRHRPRVSRRREDRLQLVVGQPRDHRRHHHPHRHARRASAAGSPPAAASARPPAAPSRRPGPRSSVVTEIPTRTSRCAAIGASRSRSRSISVPLVVIATGWSKVAQHLQHLAHHPVLAPRRAGRGRCWCRSRSPAARSRFADSSRASTAPMPGRAISRVSKSRPGDRFRKAWLGRAKQ